MKSIEFRTDPMFLRNQFKGDGVFEIPQLKINEIDLEEIELIGYDKLCDNKPEAIVHFFMDDYKFDGPVSGVWNAPRRSWDILSHFAGLITPDFSTCADFPFPVKCYNTYRMRAYGYWYGTQGGSVINNVRWGTKETFSYCFDGIPQESIVAIGVVASGLKECHNRPVFEQGFYRMLDVLNPRTIVVYGSDKYHCFDVVRKRVNIIAFPSETSMAFGRRKA